MIDNIEQNNNVQAEQTNTESTEIHLANEPSSSTPSADSSTHIPSADEKLLKQSEVNELVGRVKKEAYEKARKEAETLHMTSQMQLNNAQQPGVGNNNDEQLRVRQEIMRMQTEAWANKTAGEFVQKIEGAKDRYPDIEQVVDKLNLRANAHIVPWANTLDNAADVIYELGKNPAKYANVLMLANSGAPALAIQAMRELSESIKQNEQAKKEAPVAKPINQLNPSIHGVDSGSDKTISNIAKGDWLKRYV